MRMGTVFNIQRFSIHDGPGIRTTVFLKGCNNRCLWCHNPESLQIKPQIQTYWNKCIGCGSCFSICPNGCHKIMVDGEQGERIFQREQCVGCGKCVDSCFANALVLCGEERSAQQVLQEVLQDEPYYKQSGGGVTISGGEPFLQFDFLIELLKLFKKHNLHTTIQTALNIPFDRVLTAAPYVDLFLCDFKIYDPTLHEKYVGNDGARIRENLKRLPELSALGCEYAVRTPIIGGVNDTEEEIGNIVAFLNAYVQPLYYELMPYHNLGMSKSETLGMEQTAFFTPSEEKMEALRALIK